MGTKKTETINFKPTNNQRLAVLCGSCNENLHEIESLLQVKINQKSSCFQISGDETQVQTAKRTLQSIYQQTLSAKHITLKQVCSIINKNNPIEDHQAMQIITHKKNIQPKNPHQINYLTQVMKNDINFAIGPAGTGKTYLAVACAIEAFEKGDVERLIFVRPAVEAGEKLGFLPGDLVEKVLPYLRPIYDALYELLGFKEAQKLIERQVIEIAPLAFMRGRTLNDAFILLDEAQNTTVSQMKMFLTRMGFGSKAVITGDITQIDLPHGVVSGLNDAAELLKDIPNISINHFDAFDVVRHPLVSKIIQAYEK